MNTETIAMEMIIHSGNCRSEAFQALRLAKGGKQKEALEKLTIAKEEALKAHRVQTQLIQGEAKGERAALNLLLIHAQDHLMTSILAKDLIEEILDLYSEKNQEGVG